MNSFLRSVAYATAPAIAFVYTAGYVSGQWLHSLNSDLSLFHRTILSMIYHFVSEDGWEDIASNEEECWELTKLYTMAGTPYTVAIEEEKETMEGKYLSDSLSHPSLTAQERNQFLN